MSVSASNPDALIAELGEEIYARLYKEQYERECAGKFAAIDVDSETSYVADTFEAALRDAHASSPNSRFHVIQIGTNSR